MMKTSKKNITTRTAHDKVLKYKNRLNGEMFCSKSHHNSKFIDGVEFLSVYREVTPGIRPNYFWMRKDNLELL